MNQSRLSDAFSIKNNTFFIIILTLSAFLFRLFIGVAYYNVVDLVNFNVGWMESLKDGLFDVYARDNTIDYPPVFLMLLYPFSGFLNFEMMRQDENLLMLTVKLVPILIDSLIVPLMWVIFKDRSPKLGIITAALWAVNASGIVNSSLWGQTDTIMAFLLILCFYFLETDHYKTGCILYAIACLTKFQSLYFAPVVVLELITRYNWKKTIIGILSGIGAGAVIFLPFMIFSSRPMLIFDLYLGGFGKYNYATLNAYNLYGVLGLNGISTDDYLGYSTGGTLRSVLNIFNISTFGWVMMALALILIVTMYFTAKRKSIWIFGMLFMELIFMLTTKMHERYQFIVVPLCLVGAIMVDDVRLFISHILLTAMTGLNQLILLLAYNKVYVNFWYNYFDKILWVMSVLNVLLMLYVIYAVVRWAYFDSGKKVRSAALIEQADASDAA